jgi:hypothetical protein
MAQTELLPFSPSTPKRTTCRGALPLADKKMRWMRRNISSRLAFVVWRERMGTTSIPVARSAVADMGLSVMPASISSWVIKGFKISQCNIWEATIYSVCIKSRRSIRS